MLKSWIDFFFFFCNTTSCIDREVSDRIYSFSPQVQRSYRILSALSRSESSSWVTKSMLLLALVGIRDEIRTGTLSKGRLEYWRWNRDDWSQGVPKSTSRVLCSVWSGGRQEGAYHSPSPRYRFCAGQTVPGLGLGAWARAKLGHQTGLGLFPHPL